MNTRDTINELLNDYKASLDELGIGFATIKQQHKTMEILDEISLITMRLLVIHTSKKERETSGHTTPVLPTRPTTTR